MKADKSHKSRKAIVAGILCLCVAAITAGGSIAYLKDNTDTLSNEFAPAKVTCAVEEVFENGVKEDVRVRNTGNIDAYIRAAVVATFVSDDGKVLSKAPVEGTDYTVIWSASDWQKGTDGYWYHKKAVAPDGLTEALIQTATVVTAPEGYRLNIRIIATAIQTAPETAVKEAWGVNLSNGELMPH